MSFSEVFRLVRSFLLPYLFVLCICLLLKLVYTKAGIYFAVNSVNSPLLDFLAPLATDLGNGWTAVAISLVLVFFSYRKALILASSWTVTSLLAQLLKYIFDAPRPLLYFQDQLKRIHLIKGVEMLRVHSFPSGHTVTAFTMGVLFTYWSKNKALGPLFLLIAVIVGYSRMYLSEHFFEDVTAGSVIGVLVTLIWLYWLDNKAFIHRAKWQKGLLG